MTSDTRRARRATLILPILIVVLVVGMIAPSARASARSTYLHIINHSRIAHGLRPVRLNFRLSRTAVSHTRAMIRFGRLYDFSNLGTILAPYAGYQHIGADVVGCGSTLRAMHRQMMHHAVHRRILLNTQVRHVGIGVIRVAGRSGCGRNMVWATAIFYG